MIHETSHTASIARAIDDVYDFVATPALRPRYMSDLVSTEGASLTQPVDAGVAWREHMHIAAWHGALDWRVEIAEHPTRFVMSAVAAGDSLVGRMTGEQHLRVEYTLSGDAQQTRLARTLSITLEGLLAIAGDALGLGAAVNRTEEVAISVIASLLESPLQRAPQPDPSDPALLHESDALAEAALLSLVGPDGDCSALEAFIAGMYRGVTPSENVPQPMREFLAVSGTRPSWASDHMLGAASRVFLDWGVLSAAAHICASLPETYMFPRTAKLLALTRQLDSDSAHVDRRLWFTARMLLDVLAEGSLSPGGTGILAMQRLRLIHAMIRLFITHRLSGSNRLARLASLALWDSENGLPISQMELLHTLMTFSHVVLRSLDRWECGLTPYQHESYVHLWNVAGVILGVREDLLPRDAAQAKATFDSIKAAYAAPTPESQQLGRALVDFWTALLPLITKQTALELMQANVTTLLDRTTIAGNGLDTLPTAPPDCIDAAARLLDNADHRFASHFANAPASRKAAAALIFILEHEITARYQTDSGEWNIPQTLEKAWAARRRPLSS